MFRLFVVVLVSLSLIACTSMRPVEGRDKKAVQTAVKVGDDVAVFAVNGKVYLLTLTEVDDQKIVGIGDNKKVTIRYEQITSMEVRKLSVGKTAGLTVGVIVGVVAAAIVVGALLFAHALNHLGDDDGSGN